MAMAKKDFISRWKGTLAQIQEVFDKELGEFGDRTSIAVDLLEVSLKALVEMNLLSKCAVDVSGCTEEGKVKVLKFWLGKKEVEDEEGYWESVPCLKQSWLEQDE